MVLCKADLPSVRLRLLFRFLSEFWWASLTSFGSKRSMLCALNGLNDDETFGIQKFAILTSTLIILILNFLLNFIFNLWFIQWYYESIWETPEKHERHKLLFSEFNNRKLKNLLFYGHFTLHRVLFSIVIVWMIKFPFYQWVCLVYLSLWMLIKTFWVYNDVLPNFLNTFNCLILLIYSCMLFLFLSLANPDRLKISGFVSIILWSYFS